MRALPTRMVPDTMSRCSRTALLVWTPVVGGPANIAVARLVAGARYEFKVRRSPVRRRTNQRDKSRIRTDNTISQTSFAPKHRDHHRHVTHGRANHVVLSIHVVY